MFKLIKIVGEKSSIPEITTMPIDKNASFYLNTIAFLENGMLRTTRENYESAIYCPIEYVKAGTKDTIKCFKVTSNMLFETGYGGVSPDEFKVGDGLCLYDNMSLDFAEGNDVYIESLKHLYTRDMFVIRFNIKN